MYTHYRSLTIDLLTITHIVQGSDSEVHQGAVVAEAVDHERVLHEPDHGGLACYLLHPGTVCMVLTLDGYSEHLRKCEGPSLCSVCWCTRASFCLFCFLLFSSHLIHGSHSRWLIKILCVRLKGHLCVQFVGVP